MKEALQEHWYKFNKWFRSYSTAEKVTIVFLLLALASIPPSIYLALHPIDLRNFAQTPITPPSEITPTPTFAASPTPTLALISPTPACKTGIRSMRTVEYCKNRAQYKKVRFVCQSGYTNTLQGQCKPPLYWFREAQKACKNSCSVPPITPTPTVHL